jgi:hypothetical protein
LRAWGSRAAPVTLAQDRSEEDMGGPDEEKLNRKGSAIRTRKY